MSKGVSPLIALVLIIAFTVAIAGIVSAFLTGLATTQVDVTGDAGEKQILCGRSVLELDEVTSVLNSTVTGSDNANVTLVYTYGTEPLYNFTLIFVDDKRNAFTINQTSMNPQFHKGSASLQPGMMAVWNLNLTNISINQGGVDSLRGGALSSVRVRALCQDDYPVSGECKANWGCMK